MSKIVIIGAGAMGSAFALPCLDNNHDINIVGTHLENNFIDSLKKNNNFHPGLNTRIAQEIKIFKDLSNPMSSNTKKLDKIKRLKKKDINIKKDILIFSSDIFLSEPKIDLLITLFGLINFKISDDVILRRI